MKYPPYHITPASRARIHEAIDSAPDGYVVQIQEETRTLEQNRLLWPILQLWSKHKQANVNGHWIKITREAWKILLIADWRHEEATQPQMAITPGGVIVPLGFETHAMPKSEFTRFLSWLIAETQNAGMDLPPRAVEGYECYLGRVA